MGPDDTELIQRWQKGDVLALERLVRRWQPSIARFLFRLVGSADLVQDLCQETFLRVYRAGPRYHEDAGFAPWLYRIALNLARDAGRRRRRQPLLNDGRELVDGQASADVVCQQHESVRLVARAVAELPEPLREVLVLRHYEGMKFEEIARLTGTPASTLKSRFAAALGRLRTRLQQLGLGPEEEDR